jgi:hypothetical protein
MLVIVVYSFLPTSLLIPRSLRFLAPFSAVTVGCIVFFCGLPDRQGDHESGR